MRSAWIFVLLTLPLLSGCLDGGAALDSNGDGVPDGQEHAPVEAHGTPQRTDGVVEVEQTSNGNWRARQQVLIRNGFGDAVRGDVTLATTNGFATLAGAEAGGYTLQADLFATGDSEQDARDRLATLRVEHTDRLSGDTVALETRITVEQGTLPDIPVNINGNGGSRGGSLTLVAPADAVYSADLDTTNGWAQATGVDGSTLTADTTNGWVTAVGAWDEMDLSTTNGWIEVVGGRRTEGAGTYSLHTTNGRISVALDTEDAGYDVTGDTTNGDVTIMLPGTSPLGQQSDEHRHERTDGFDDMPQRTTLTAKTTNGDITIGGA